MDVPGFVKIRATWDTLRTSYWFVPTLMAVASVILWVACYSIDILLADSTIHTLSWIYTGGPDGAREMLAVVAGSMITIAGVTFSITIVALTLASQQFGPFLLRNFMRDTGNQIVLGTFISTFLFCLLTLRVIRGTEQENFVPHLSVSVAVLLAIFSLGVLIYFIHHVSAFIQASNIISVVGRDLNEAIDRLFPERLGSEQAGRDSSQGQKPDEELSAARVRSSAYGYIKAVDNDALLKTATDNDLVVALLKRPGDFVGEGDVVAHVWPDISSNDEVNKSIANSLILGSQRTATQDVEFVFSQIVEIAVRSLSPGINDPFTAIICIDHLGQGLRRMAGRSIPSPFRCADDGALRVVAMPATFSELADAAFNQIRHYGRASEEVLNRLLQTITEIAHHLVREEDRQAMLRHAALIAQAGRAGVPEKDARWSIQQAYDRARTALMERQEQHVLVTGPGKNE